MTIMVKLCNAAGTTLVDLGATGTYRPRPGQPAQIGDQDERLITTLELVSVAASDTRVEAVEALLGVLHDAGRYNRDWQGNDEVWLHMHDNEAEVGERRALVYGGTVQMKGGSWSSGKEQGGRASHGVEVAIEHALWEKLTATTVTLDGLSLTASSVLPAIAGSRPGRIGKMSITPTHASGIMNLAVGIRPILRHGSFDPSLTKASPFSRTYVPADVGEELEVWSAPLSSICTASDFRGQQGRYRVYTDVTTANIPQWALRIAAGDAAGNVGDSHTFGYTGGGYRGVITLPPMGRDLSSSEIGKTVVTVYGTAHEITGASGTISVANLYLIPDWCWIQAANARLDGLGSELIVNRSASDTRMAELYSLDATGNPLIVRGDFGQWHYPREGGRLSWYGSRVTGFGMAQGANITLQVYPRWAAYRDQ
jgi:hypothetical protein